MKKPIDKKLLAATLLVSAVVLGSLAYSHCQIPCGIYDDEARFSELAEHITTIEKSMKEIVTLSADSKPDMNQVVRWVNNKDIHADELSEIVTYYFMAQRIKLPPTGDTKAQNAYVAKLSLLHEMLVHAMKTKQSIDQANVDKLRAALEKFHKAYTADAG